LLRKREREREKEREKERKKDTEEGLHLCHKKVLVSRQQHLAVAFQTVSTDASWLPVFCFACKIFVSLETSAICKLPLSASCIPHYIQNQRILQAMKELQYSSITEAF